MAQQHSKHCDQMLSENDCTAQSSPISCTCRRHGKHLLRQLSEQATKHKQAAVGLKSSFRYSQMSTGSGPGPGGGGDEGGGGGGGSQGASRGSWAQVLGSNLPSSWNKNVLEVVLEKDDRGAFIVSAVDCANMMRNEMQKKFRCTVYSVFTEIVW